MLVFVIALVVFIWSVAPTITPGDAGELVAAAVTNGVAHPPGYPWFSIIGHVCAAVVPMGTMAFRVALASAVCSAGALAMWARISREMIVRPGSVFPKETLRPGGASAMISFMVWMAIGMSPAWMGMAIEAEVYSVHTLLLGWVVWCAYRWRGEGFHMNRWAWGMWGGVGVALAHHHLMVLALPLVAGWWMAGKPRWTDTVTAALVAGMGVAAYLALPLSGMATAGVIWGTPCTFTDLIAHISRRQYGALTVHPRTLVHFAAQGAACLEFVREQMPWGWWIAASAGVIVMSSAARWWLIGLLVSQLMGMMLVLRYAVTPELLSIVQAFMVPSLSLIGAMMAVGVERPAIRWAGQPRAWWWAAGIGVSIIGLTGFSRHGEPARALISYELCRNVLETARPGEPLLLSGDNLLFGVVYLQAVEGWAPEVPVYEDSGRLASTLTDRELGQVANEGSVCTAMWSRWASRLEALNLSLIPAGVVYRVGGTETRPSQEGWRRLRLDEALWNGSSAPLPIRVVQVQYWYGRGERTVADEGFTGEAFRYCERARALGWDLERLQFNIGRFYEKMERFEDAMHAYAHAVWVNPGYSLPYNNMGVRAFRTGHVEEAIASFDMACDADPSNVEALNNLGSALASRLQSGDLDRAKAVWDRALRLSPGHPLVLQNLRKVSVTP